MIKSALTRFAQKKVILTGVLLMTGLVMISLPSCKHQEDCGAYQGSGKSSRSYKSKKHHRHAQVVNLPQSTLIG